MPGILSSSCCLSLEIMRVLTPFSSCPLLSFLLLLIEVLTAGENKLPYRYPCCWKEAGLNCYSIGCGIRLELLKIPKASLKLIPWYPLCWHLENLTFWDL